MANGLATLRDFQIQGVRQIYRFNGRALLADDQGLGKTVQALSWITRIPKHRPVVIVTPASMKYTWRSEALSLFGIRIEVLEGRRPKRCRELPGPIIILNYDILKSWLPLLLRAKAKVVVFDEIHFCTNRKAQRTKAAIKLSEGAASVVGLSGTPMTNRPVELWSVLKIIRPDIFPVFQEFAFRYCKPKWTPWGWTYKGSAHAKELNKILRSECMIRRLKSEVAKDLPSKTRRTILFRLHSYIEYRKAESNFISWLQTVNPAKAMRARKSQALTRIGYLLRLVAKLKLPWTIRWIEDFFEAHPGKKLVAFTMHTAVIDALQEHFEGRCVVIDGRVKSRLKEEAKRRFQTHSKTDLLLGNWKAAGVGHTLTAAHNAAALDLPWVPGDLLQGEDRIHRIGQEHDVFMHYLTAMNTVEEKQMKVLRRQAVVLDQVLNGTAEAEELDIFGELLREMNV